MGGGYSTGKPKYVRDQERAARIKAETQARLLASQQKERFQRQKPKTLFDTVIGIDKSIYDQTTLGA